MKPVDKSAVYRQLYHAANGMENRFLRPSASSVNGYRASGPSPLLNTKVIAAAVGIGVSLAAVFAAFRSLGKPDNPEPEGETPPVESTDEEKEAEAEEANVEEPEDEDPGLWDRILKAFGFGEEEDPGLVDLPESSTEPTQVRPPETPSEKGVAKPKAPAKPSGPPESGVVLIARGAELNKKKPADRESQKGNPLFTGRYARLAKANLSTPELAWATKLAKMGVSISGRMGKSMLPVVKSVIIARAKAHGLDPEDMLKVASMESGGDPNAVSSTGAIGIFQFTAATARAFGLNNRFDLDANVEAGMLLTKANLKSLPNTTSGPLAVYIAHQIGISGAKEVLSSPRSKPIARLKPRTQKSIRVNVGGKSKTVGEYLDANQAKLDASYSQQLAAAPFKGEVKIHLASSSPTERVASSVPVSLPDQTKTSGSVVSMSSTTVPVEQPSSPPDMSYHAKIDPPEPASSEPAQSEQVASVEKSVSDGHSYQKSQEPFQSAFQTKDGTLVVM